MKMMRFLPAALLGALLAACSLTKPPFEPPVAKEPVAVEVAPPPAPVYAPPVDTHLFEIDAEDDVVGQVQVTVVGEHDTLSDIARRFNVGYEEIVRANPGVDPWLPGVGREVVVPTQFVLPSAERKGIVVNLAAMRVFYFPAAKAGEKQQVYTHPIGIGKVGWTTPEGKTKVVSKQKDPTWIPPASVRAEHKANGEILPAVVPAGPDNPLGRYKFTLGWAGYLIHGTNKPYGVGLRSSHGCIRMYPEDVEKFFGMVNPGTQVTVVNQPYVFGWHEGQLYLQAFDVFEDDRRDWSKSRPALVSKTLSKRVQQQLAASQESIDWARVAAIAKDPRGLPVPVSLAATDDAAIIAAAPRVENRIPDGANWDGADDPTLQAKADAEERASEQRQVPNG